jgi:hypothetical protein
VNQLSPKDISNRTVTRICHFTQSRNLVHIATHRDGVKSTKALHEEQEACFTATDKIRYDGFTDHICCSIEYPNAWYLAKASEHEELFRDWVILFVTPRLLLDPETRFCARNAAAARGKMTGQGKAGFEAMYADSVEGAYGKIRYRDAGHLACCPTDEQAEVLIRSKIPLADLMGVAVKNEEQARNEMVRLKFAGVDPKIFRFVIAPVLFDKYGLSRAIRSGQRPAETIFHSE